MMVDDGMAEQGRQFFGDLLHGPGPWPGWMIGALQLRGEFLHQRHACHVGDIAGIDEVHAPVARRAGPGTGGDLTSCSL